MSGNRKAYVFRIICLKIMKKLLITLGILVLLVIGVLLVPPIYNRFTKPFFKNTVDAKEWYHQVDCENLTQVRDYCDRREGVS